MCSSLHSKHYPELATLLDAAGLPVEDLRQVRWFKLLGEFENDKLIAAGGLEQCENQLLLRSLVTAGHHQGRGLAGKLLNALIAYAADAGFNTIWLLTTDAEGYFAVRHQFTAVERKDVAQEICDSNQFSHLCPESATVMCKRLV